MAQSTTLYRGDSLAQTFFVNSGKHPLGIFLTKIQLFFQEKDDSFPVFLEINFFDKRRLCRDLFLRPNFRQPNFHTIHSIMLGLLFRACFLAISLQTVFLDRREKFRGADENFWSGRMEIFCRMDG